MNVPVIKSNIPCPVCGTSLDPVPAVICGQCGSELNFDNQKDAGAVVKRGSIHFYPFRFFSITSMKLSIRVFICASE